MFQSETCLQTQKLELIIRIGTKLMTYLLKIRFSQNIFCDFLQLFVTLPDFTLWSFTAF